MNIKKLSENAVIPTRGSKEAAGYDLYATETYELKIGERKAFKTDIVMAIPPYFFGRISPRSGLAVKKGIDVLAGIIDSDYRGEILVVLINLGQESVTINSGDKIAQIILQQYGEVTNGFNVVDNLDDTDRGNNGFGSTDIKPEDINSTILREYNKHHASESGSNLTYEQKVREQSKK